MWTTRQTTVALLMAFVAAGAHADGEPMARYAERAEIRAFIDELVARDGFDGAELATVFAGIEPVPRVLALIRPPATPKAKSWLAYRAIFIEPQRIAAGRAFMAAHAVPLARAQARYGVPREIIAAIIGVETLYGRHTGKFETLSALATLAFDYPPRAALFRAELRELLLLAREAAREPASYRGSYAGALGLPQFLPSSLRRLGVDFDRDGRIDIADSVEDAIGSVANYLADYGWQREAPIAVRVQVDAGAETAIAAGIEPTRTPREWREAGLAWSNYSDGGTAVDAPDLPVALIDLPSPDAPTEYRLGYRNFWVLTRYNRANNYAAAVMDLAAALK